MTRERHLPGPSMRTKRHNDVMQLLAQSMALGRGHFTLCLPLAKVELKRGGLEDPGAG
jgi:hypothetical protein